MLNHDLVLKSDELYLAGQITSDGGERAAGLYLRDTRHLSRFTLSLDGAGLTCLSERMVSAAVGVINLTNDLLRLPDGDVLPQTLFIEERVELGTALRVTVTVHNYAGRPLSLALGFEVAADFRDLFDIRGAAPAERGALLPPDLGTDTLTLRYNAVDSRQVSTAITFDRPMQGEVLPPATDAGVIDAGPLTDVKVVRAEPSPPSVTICRVPLTLAPGDISTVNVTVSPHPADEAESPVSARPVLSGGGPMLRATVQSDNDFFDRYLERSDADLELLQTTFPIGSLPAAGIPWYVAPFGRDTLIVGLQTVHVYPVRAAGILRALAACQGTRVDPWRAEEPGKILHEVRYGEMARTGSIPHTPYYGTVDATPLFVLLFAETVGWSDDRALYDELLPNVRRALEWIERYGDVDGDGLVEYRTEASGSGHISNKVWKDSGDSLHYRDGRQATGVIAAVEVQGYIYAGLIRLAEVAAHMGDATWAEELRARAERVRQAVEQRFWMEADGFYAQALDGDKRPVDAITSNPGHLLFCGLPSPARAARVARRLAAPDLNSGWGIRTLSAAMPTYNPMSYHNGSVWPHDNSLIVAGLDRYGEHDLALAITLALFQASMADPLHRLPELYCGFSRDGQEDTPDAAPVAYPVSCSPQAWAAASAHLLVRTLLGLRADLTHHRVLVDPVLPEWLHTLTHTNLAAFGERYWLSVKREGNTPLLASDGPVQHVPLLASAQGG